MATISCSSEKIDEPLIEKITPQTKQFELEDFTSVGLKKNKTYKVEELPKALSAYFGFIRFNEPAEDGKGKKVVEYELRFYNSHEDAINYGAEYAEERVGPNAKLKKTHNKHIQNLVQNHRSILRTIKNFVRVIKPQVPTHLGWDLVRRRSKWC